MCTSVKFTNQDNYHNVVQFDTRDFVMAMFTLYYVIDCTPVLKNNNIVRESTWFPDIT